MDLTNLSDIKALLARHGFHFSKSMGQNFLIEDWVPRDIAEASGADGSCGVVEIGPGIGPTAPCSPFWRRPWAAMTTWRSSPAM